MRNEKLSKWILVVAFIVTWDSVKSKNLVPCPNQLWINVSSTTSFIGSCIVKTVEKKSSKLKTRAEANALIDSLKNGTLSKMSESENIWLEEKK